MIWPWYGLIASGVLVTVVTAVGIIDQDGGWSGWKIQWFILDFFAVVVCVVFLAMSLIGTIGPNIDKSKCAKFDTQTGYHTKFVRYNALSWDCLVEVKPGRWVSKDSIRGITLN